MGANTQKIGDALVAKGYPSWIRYIVDPLYLSPLFTEASHLRNTPDTPSVNMARSSFERGLCPHAEAALDSVIAIHWNENLTDDHVREVAAAISNAAH